MTALSVVYQPARDNFELKTVGTVHVLSLEQVERLLYDLRHALWEHELAVSA